MTPNPASGQLPAPSLSSSSPGPQQPPPSPPYHLTIRFSASHPDIDLDIPSPQSTTVLSLKQRLRQRLSSRSRLRLIHQGRILPDEPALSAVLKPPSPPPPARSAPEPHGKGKARAGEHAPPPVRIYVNCSVGDELSDQELEAERAAALRAPWQPGASAAAGIGRSSRDNMGDNNDNNYNNSSSSISNATPLPSTRPRPRGFDRLLQAGFSNSEIATLRTQFASIHAERQAPDDPPPSPDTMRGLEDAWIDSNAGELPTVTLGAAGGVTLEDEMGDWMVTVADVLVRGMMVGFFFPLGSLTWLLRLQIYNDKWQVFVGAGVVLSLAVGVIMGLGGDRS